MSDHNEVDFEEIEEELEESELICERYGEYKQMGMYAEINVCFDLTKGTPKNVVDVLYYLIDDNDKPSDLPNHEFFKCDRWDMVKSV